MNQQESWQVEVQGQIYEASFDELTQWINEGALLREDKVRRGNLRWLEAGKIPALYGFFNAKELGSVNPPVVTTTSGDGGSEKSQSVQTPTPAPTVENQMPLTASPAFAPPSVLPPPLPPPSAGQGAFNQPPPPTEFAGAGHFHQSSNPDQHAFQNSYRPSASLNQQQQPPVYTEVPDLVKAGANWFFWIAGLSLVNTLIMALGGDWAFITGLAVTQIVDVFFEVLALESGASGISAIGFLVNLVIAGAFVLFGVLGRRGAGWAILVGMILYTVDGAIYLLAGSFLGVVVHGIALFYLWRGWQACD